MLPRFIARRAAWAGPGVLLAGALLCAPAWPAGQTLTLDELARLLKVIDKQGSRVMIPQAVATVLQLQPAQRSPDIKEAAYLDDEGLKHGFGPLNDGSGYFMFSGSASQGQTVYVVDPSLHLVRAARNLIVNGPLLPLPEAEAQRDLDDEFHRWSKVLSPAGPSAPKTTAPMNPLKPFEAPPAAPPASTRP
jgi:hypothetical protein